MLLSMAFPEQLAALRRSKGLTQVALAQTCSISVPMLQRYEAGTSQPTLDVIKKLAVALGVSTDALIFDAKERGPDDDLRLQFEAAQRLDPEEKRIARALLESLIIRHDANHWNRVQATPSTAEPTT